MGEGSTYVRCPAIRGEILGSNGGPSVQGELERRATCARGVEGVVVFLWVARGMRQSFEASYHPRQQTHIEQRFICVRRGPQGFALWYSITSSSAERGSQVSRFGPHFGTGARHEEGDLVSRISNNSTLWCKEDIFDLGPPTPTRARS